MIEASEYLRTALRSASSCNGVVTAVSRQSDGRDVVIDDWYRRIGRHALGDARLFCFPHAGGTVTSFRHWDRLPALLEVRAAQLPGRADRLREPPLGSIPALAEALVQALLPYLGTRFAFFGHSMGAVLAFEVASILAARGAPMPEHLIVSGRRPPDIRSSEPDMHQLPDDMFIAEIDRRYSGIPRQLLYDHEVMALLLPGLRADITALETHRPAPCVPLDLPITAFGGGHDSLTPPAHLEAWRRLGNGAFRLRLFPGGHFYLDTQRAAVLDDLAVTLAPMLHGNRTYTHSNRAALVSQAAT